MTERGGEENAVVLTMQAIHTQEFDSGFDESDPSRRREIIADLDSKTKFLRRRNSILTRKEQQKKSNEQKGSLKQNERRHPERYVKRVLRIDGLYLDFSREEAETSIVSVQKYLETVRPHIGRHGEDSIANLCPSKSVFVALTSGVELRSHTSHTEEVVFVNTIEDLKRLRSILVDDGTIVVYRHNPQALTRSNALNLKNLFGELDEWKANKRSKKA